MSEMAAAATTAASAACGICSSTPGKATSPRPTNAAATMPPSDELPPAEAMAAVPEPVDDNGMPWQAPATALATPSAESSRLASSV